MRVRGFLQNPKSGPTTAAALLDVHGRVQSNDFLGCYAYATQSGAASFDLQFGAGFWSSLTTRWLFGLDYGRTHPKALSFIQEKPNTEVRIHDGAWIVDQVGFVPRCDYHMKSGFLLNSTDGRFGMVAGSGNFSANGLSQSIECGVALFASENAEYVRTFRKAHRASEELWNAATPLDEVLELYTATWTEQKLPPAPTAEAEFAPAETFWIEAGYVTRNRGLNRPGNQIDMPRGMNRLFGFHAPANQPINSIIGAITFLTPSGEEVTRNLRLGNNHMEKITLPIPEDHGLDMYDGKVLLFHQEGGKYRMWALEEDDFGVAFGDRVADVRVMGSGRRFGYINE